MTLRHLRLGISTCPNDTFLFHGLLTGRVPTPGLELDFELLDIEELNQGLLEDRFDAAKGSFALGLALSRTHGVLPTGSALGFGNGPLLLARAEGVVPGPDARVLCPGEHTTATLLYRLFHGAGRVEQVPFHAILPALQRGEADLGVCIHEGRFTYREAGLHAVEDLGRRWERETGAPLPLGGLLARRDLGPEVLVPLQDALARSLAYAHAHRRETHESMGRYAQELSPEVLEQHVDLYVNEHTRDLGEVGRAALAELSRRARAAGLLGAGAPDLGLLLAEAS